MRKLRALPTRLSPAMSGRSEPARLVRLIGDAGVKLLVCDDVLQAHPDVTAASRHHSEEHPWGHGKIESMGAVGAAW